MSPLHSRLVPPRPAPFRRKPAAEFRFLTSQRTPSNQLQCPTLYYEITIASRGSTRRSASIRRFNLAGPPFRLFHRAERSHLHRNLAPNHPNEHMKFWARARSQGPCPHDDNSVIPP